MAEQRVTLSLSQDQFDFIKREAERTGQSMADVVRRSILKNKYIKELADKGQKLTVEQSDGRLRDIEFLD